MRPQTVPSLTRRRSRGYVVVEGMGRGLAMPARPYAAARTPQAPQLSGGAARKYGPRGLHFATLDRPTVLEYEAARPATDTADHPFQSDEAGRAVLALGQQVLQRRLALDVAAEDVGHAGAGELQPSAGLAVGLLIPRLRLERTRRVCAHPASSLSIQSCHRRPLGHTAGSGHKRS